MCSVSCTIYVYEKFKTGLNYFQAYSVKKCKQIAVQRRIKNKIYILSKNIRKNEGREEKKKQFAKINDDEKPINLNQFLSISIDLWRTGEATSILLKELAVQAKSFQIQHILTSTPEI